MWLILYFYWTSLPRTPELEEPLDTQDSEPLLYMGGD